MGGKDVLKKRKKPSQPHKQITRDALIPAPFPTRRPHSPGPSVVVVCFHGKRFHHQEVRLVLSMSLTVLDLWTQWRGANQNPLLSRGGSDSWPLTRVLPAQSAWWGRSHSRLPSTWVCEPAGATAANGPEATVGFVSPRLCTR